MIIFVHFNVDINKDELFNEMDMIVKGEFILCKCIYCGYEQQIPSWLIEIEEMNEE